MKKTILAATLLGIAAAGVQTATAGGVSFGLHVGLPLPAPVVYAPPVIHVAPAPRVVYAPPVYHAPPPPAVVYGPAYYAPRPVYYPPAPVVSFRFGSGHHRQLHHGRW